jgi:hypothetical protein
VTIPGRGDLAPRRRKAPIGRFIVTALVIGLLAGGAYAAYLGLTVTTTNGTSSNRPLGRCPKPSTHAAFAPAKQVKVRIYNASLRTGLAASVRKTLRQRGFHVVMIGNAPRVGHYVAAIRYSSDQVRESRTLAAQFGGAQSKQLPGHGVLAVDLGVKFAQLRSVAAAKAAEHQLASAPPTPTPTGTPTCRPRFA